MRVIVCGGRDCTRELEVRNWLSAQHKKAPITLLINGGAPGVDTIARKWAEWHDVPVLTFKANWDAHGRAAGPIRNQRMLVEGRPKFVIAIDGGRGTADMLRRAKRAGVLTVEVLTRGESCS